jgi:NADH:ubiquinone oxidoreductase subunit F (NADH-binding)/NADH:ubiquinone oxidoreductase subunit E/Pyruvate/2-oxoacid:ferredoxin oxidoreductase delta subunit
MASKQQISTQPPAPAIDLSLVDEVVKRLGGGGEQAIPILQALQAHYRYLPDAALRRVCELTGIPPATLAGVASFYAQFRHRPMGRHHVKVCDGTACHIHGAENIHEALRHHLHLAANEDTDANGTFTVEKVFCVGCCTLAPVVQINDTSIAHLTREAVPAMLDDFVRHEARARKRRKLAIEPPPPTATPDGEIRICLDSCCIARGCGKTHEALQTAVAKGHLNATIKRVGCVVMCDRTPLIEIARPGHAPEQFSGIQPDRVDALLARFFQPRGLLPWLRRGVATGLDWLAGESTPPHLAAGRTADNPSPRVAAFFGRQRHIATEHFGTIDPLNLHEYLAHEGFAGLRKCLTDLTPVAVIDVIDRSGLRGRGGAGFPTARKWRVVHAITADEKFVICNGDEGDPGAFMDRMLMESFPFRVIEGMAIAAFAVGAAKGYIYVRAEYPSAVRRLREALRLCKDSGVLGPNIFDTGFALDIEVFEGAGAFVCGEETAMLESMEGRRGIPRLKPPYPAEQGYHDKPTLINNVETYANVPWILRHGGEAFAAIGSATSKGTKVFALAGKIARGGLIEVPMGISIREVVDDIGGGTPDGSPFKAVLVGGPSGGCIPASLADTPIDYESLTKVGAIMGSGGLIVLDASDCMVQMARYFLDFCQCESCGKCTFCRIGTRRMLDILDRICKGKGKTHDLTELETLSDMVCRASLCGLGRTAPNPVLSSLRFFREEFEAHLHGHCPAGKCRDLITYSITDACIGCTLCAQHCPVSAIPLAPYQKHVILDDLCTRCNACREVCPENAVLVR